MRFRTASILLLATALPWSAAVAQSWPAKPVRLIVPFAPGGTADTLGRLVAAKLGDTFKETLVVENRGGAGGVVGSELVAKSAPDGYTLVVSGVASHCIAPALSKNFPFDPLRDFTHIALFGGPPTVLVVYPGLEATDLKSFVALSKSRAGGITFASGVPTVWMMPGGRSGSVRLPLTRGLDSAIRLVRLHTTSHPTWMPSATRSWRT